MNYLGPRGIDVIAPVLSIRMLVARRVSSAPCTLPGHARFDGLLTTRNVASHERLDGFAVERMQRQRQGCHESGKSHETPHVPAPARVVPGLQTSPRGCSEVLLVYPAPGATQCHFHRLPYSAGNPACGPLLMFAGSAYHECRSLSRRTIALYNATGAIR